MSAKHQTASILVAAALLGAAVGGRASAPRHTPGAQSRQAPGSGNDGFTALFNGRDLAGWKIPPGDNGHWRVVDGVIDYDAESEAPGEKSLFSERSFKDFALRVDWRIKSTPYINPSVPIIRFDGTHKKAADGKEIR